MKKNKSDQRPWQAYLTPSYQFCMHCNKLLFPSWAHKCEATVLSNLISCQKKFEKMSQTVQDLNLKQKRLQDRVKQQSKQMKKLEVQLKASEEKVEENIKWMEQKGEFINLDRSGSSGQQQQPRVPRQEQKQSKKVRQSNELNKRPKQQKLKESSFQFSSQDIPVPNQQEKNEALGFQQILKDLHTKDQKLELSTSYTSQKVRGPEPKLSDLFDVQD